MLEYTLYLFAIIMVVKIVCNHIELVGWIHYSNQLKKQEWEALVKMYDGDEECAILDIQDKFKGIDSDLGYKKWEFENGKSNSHYNIQVVKPDYSLINNKAKKLVDFWSYYFDQVLCRKDLLSSADPQIKVIYYCRLISTMIDMTIAPQPVAVQFIGIFLDSLRYSALKISNKIAKRAKKVDLNTLPEETQKRLRDAEREAA